MADRADEKNEEGKKWLSESRQRKRERLAG